MVERQHLNLFLVSEQLHIFFIPSGLVCSVFDQGAFHYIILEVELISLMDRNGIGTDATITQHISTIQDRAYATKDHQQKFLPTKLGIALVEGYNR